MDQLTGVRYVLFDAVGTLMYVRPSVAEVYLAVASRHGTRSTVRQIRERFQAVLQHQADGGATSEDRERDRWRSIVAEVLPDVSHADPRPFMELWAAFASAAQWALFPDVANTWSQLRARGYSLAIASNFDLRLVTICRDLPPLDAATRFFLSSQVGYSKPHPEFFQRVRHNLAAEAEEILMVGDSFEHDVAGARRAGWRAIHLDRQSRVSNASTISSLTTLLTVLY